MASSYEEAVAGHEWHVPERFNIAAECCDKHPRDKPAMIWERFDGERRELDWGELQDLSNQAANVLRDHGVEKGERVAVVLPPTPETAAIFFGTWKNAGILLSMSVLYGDDGIRHRLEDSEPRVLITNEENKDRFADWQGGELLTIEGLLDDASTEFETADTSADDPAQLYYTSGTTGLAKGIVHAHRYVLAHEEFVYCHDVQDGERFHGMGEWAWAAGIAPLLGPWRYGALQVVLQRQGGFDPKQQLDFLSRNEVTNVFTTPTAMRAMMAIPNAADTYPQKFRVVCSAGEPLNPEAIKWFREQFGLTVLDYYGLTESYPLVANFPFMEVREGSMGRAMPGWDVQLLDEDENPVEQGERGEICLRARSNPHYPLGYWRNEEASEETFGGDWFHSKDAAQQDEDGYIWYAGRADDVIIAAGYRIGPFEVESACLEHEAVKEAAAVASPDEVKGNVVKAFIVLADGHEGSDELADEIKQHVRGRLSAYAYPRLIEFVDDLPKTLTGKIRRIELREAEIERGDRPAHPADGLAGLPAAALLLDARDRIVAANAQAEAMFGRPVAGSTTHGVLTLSHALDQAGTSPVRCEGRRADDTPFVVEARIGRAGDNALVLLREPAPSELQGEAQRYFDAAFDTAPIGMALFNTDGEYVRVNTALCGLLARPEGELLGRRDQEFTHPDDRQADLDAAFHILEGRATTHQIEKRFVRPDGGVVWAIANLTFLRDPDGRPLSWVGQFQDITARRAAEEALRDERDVSQAVIEAMDHGVAFTHQRRIVTVNDALCRMTGFAREELVGSELPFPFIPPESREAAIAVREELVTHGGGEFDIGIMRKDGTRFTASITAAEVRGPDGRSLGLVNTMRDVSERRREEIELARRANLDGLTGLLNRTSFDATLAIEVDQAQSAGRSLTLALLDLDRFKQINDEHGHPVGDAVLVETAERLRDLSRDTDHLGRVGGEEFAWILPETEPPDAERAALRACNAIRGREFPGGAGTVTISIGVCALANAADVDQLYRRADLALYAAKRAGRDRCEVWTPEM